MSPQVSNRQALLEGALRCIEERGYGNVSTREIARAAHANVASINYHFGSKDALIGQALAEGFRRWLAEFAAELATEMPGAGDTEAFIRGAVRTLGESMTNHRGMARAFLAALSRAPHDEQLREILAASYRESRTGLAALLRLEESEHSELQAGILIAVFDGLLIQCQIDPEQGAADLQQLPALLRALDVTPKDMPS
jgi:AcrR family transcriptional regulator